MPSNILLLTRLLTLRERSHRDEENIYRLVSFAFIIAFIGLLACSRDSSKTWNEKGTDLVNKGRFAEAIECYDKAIEMDPASIKAKAWYNKGAVLDYFMDRHTEAIECYDKAIEIDPNDASAWNNKGYALCKLKRYDEAKKCLRKAQKLGPPSDHITKMLERLEKEGH